MRVDRWGNTAEITIRDQGLGIPPDEQDRLFEPFRRGEGVRQTTGGAGLGLYISAQIVERHGGTISVHSEPGSGSVFTVHLPLSAPEDDDGEHADG